MALNDLLPKKRKKKEETAALKIRNGQSEEGFAISLRSM
jgi:hypothetical protein